MDYIKELINNCILENRLLNQDEISNIFLYIKKEFNLDKNIKIIFDNHSKELGSFNYKNNELVINYNSIINHVMEIEETLENYDPDYICINKITHYLYFILGILFHEITHIMQDNLILQNKNDLKTLMFKISKRIQVNKPNLYNNNEDYFPLERDANIKGYSLALKVLEGLNIVSIRDFNYLNLEFINYELLNSYEDLDSEPILFLMDKDTLNSIIGNNEINLFDKLVYGLKLNDKDKEDLLEYRTKFMINKNKKI